MIIYHIIIIIIIIINRSGEPTTHQKSNSTAWSSIGNCHWKSIDDFRGVDFWCAKYVAPSRMARRSKRPRPRAQLHVARVDERGVETSGHTIVTVIISMCVITISSCLMIDIISKYYC